MVVKKMKDAKVCHRVFWGSDAFFRQGRFKPVPISAMKAMIDARRTYEESTGTLRGLARESFKIPCLEYFP